MNLMQTYKDFIKSIQSKGIYVFSKAEALKEIETHANSLKVTLARNVKAGNITYLGQHLYLIVPPEYSALGAPPPDWYIHHLMKAHGCNYYVGLLTAAAYDGTAHQAPQIFQVICDKRLPPTRIGSSQIYFYYSKVITNVSQQKRNTPTGYMNVSPPEVTAFDLIKYVKQGGHINHVATILSELGEKIKAQRLKNVAIYYPPAYSQRLGYILDELGYSHKTETLHRFIKKNRPRYCFLKSDSPKEVFPKNEKWHIIINEKLEFDI
ncbi:MAG: type IV toxin-antitoxin system AbiEi family antitoxin [Alphaproteobacteria bacterium]|nr:type IV toxin-antitoxin system AbiEi family antitoxin [Alphaproteobacteria bacterium]